jgi:drug/metabolite transporter (DMT)-like permease
VLKSKITIITNPKLGLNDNFFLDLFLAATINRLRKIKKVVNNLDMRRNSGPLYLLIVGFLYGLYGPLLKYLLHWWDVSQMQLMRFGVVFLISLLVLIFRKKKLHFNKKKMGSIVGIAVAYAISCLCFILAVFYTKISLTIFAYYIANLPSAFLLGYFLFHEKIGIRKVFAFFSILIGLICITNPFESFHINLGFIFGLISGLSWTVVSAYQKPLKESIDPLSLLIILSASCVLFTIPLFFLNEHVLVNLPWSGWGVFVVCSIIFLFIIYLNILGFRSTDIHVGTLLTSTELFFGPLFAFLIFHEKLTHLELIGGLLTILAVILVNFKLPTRNLNTHLSDNGLVP